MRTYAITVVCLLWCTAPLIADEVYLVNGDRISGKITSLADGKLTVESDLAGKLTVDLNNVSTLKTNEPIDIHLKDGTGFRKQISKSENGRFAVSGDQTLANQDFNVASIVAINPPEKELPKWHGNISGALTSTHGNTNINTRSLSVNLNRRSEIDRTLLTTDYLYGKQRNPATGQKEVTQDEWRARGQYDYFFSKKFFGFIDTRYEKDRIAELQRRVVVGVGGGYQWVESEPFNFSTQAGIASRYETYTNGTPSSSQMSVQLGYHVDKKLGKIFTAINDLTYYPSLKNSSDYFLTTTGELRAKLTEVIFANFKVVFDFDSTPANGKGKTDVKYILGLGVTF
jgi:putative salt-induced outer membrane protein YdiY